MYPTTTSAKGDSKLNLVIITLYYIAYKRALRASPFSLGFFARVVLAVVAGSYLNAWYSMVDFPLLLDAETSDVSYMDTFAVNRGVRKSPAVIERHHPQKGALGFAARQIGLGIHSDKAHTHTHTHTS